MTKFILYSIFLFSGFSINANSETTNKPVTPKAKTKPASAAKDNAKQSSKQTSKQTSKQKETKSMTETNTTAPKTETAILAGGCFWGVEELIRNQPGVLSTEVGYTGGSIPNATYDIVKRGTSGHAESIRIEFDPQKTSFENVLKFFFRIHDPTTVNQQGNDKGSQYRSAIFFLNAEQEKTAKKVKELVDVSGAWKKPVVTEIVPASTFYSAESSHQDYLQKNPGGYTCHYVRDIKF